jgi:hypothetical protein
MNEQFFRANHFIKIFLDDKSGDYYWEKNINHPYLTDLNITVDSDFLTVNAIDYHACDEITLFASRENSIENVKDVIRKFE